MLNKNYLLALFVAILPIVSMCASPTNKPKTSHIKETVMDYIPQVKDFCNTVSEKCQSLYNPLSIATITVTSAALGLRNIGFLLVGGVIVAHADQITEFVKGYTESLEKPVQQVQPAQNSTETVETKE